MVMAINSNEASANNFAAFQALAMQINGTSSSNTTSSTNSTGTGSSTGSATDGTQSQIPDGSTSQTGSNSTQTQVPSGAGRLGASAGLVLSAIGAVFVLL